jgi:hypothetical protein
MLPYAWTRWGIDRVNRVEREPVVFYVHPWEIDPEQPRFEAGAVTRVRHYTGLGSTVSRLERMMSDFEFDSIAALLRLKADTTSRKQTSDSAAA